MHSTCGIAKVRDFYRAAGALLSLVLLVGLGARPATAQEGATAAVVAPKVAIIDVQRLLTDSKAGQNAIADLKKMQEEKVAEGRTLESEIQKLQNRIAEGKLSLTEAKLAELQKELEGKVITMRRFQDDTERVLGQTRDEAFAKIERQVLPIINGVGQEEGYTLIFNKFQSGLLFAQPALDITDDILARYDGQSQGD